MNQDGVCHIRYLESRLSKLRKRADLNLQQTEAYERILRIAKSSTSYADYLEKLGVDADLFSIAKAEHLDRNHALGNLYQKIGLTENERIFHNREAMVKNCKSYVDLAIKIPQTLSLTEERNAIERLDAASVFLQLLFQIKTFAKREAQIAKAQLAKLEFSKVKALDASFGFESYFLKPYSYINPFTRSQMAKLESAYVTLLNGKA